MKKKVIDIQPPTVLNEHELVADACEHCSRAAPPCCTESHPKVTHCAVVKFASMPEQEKPPFVSPDTEDVVSVLVLHGR